MAATRSQMSKSIPTKSSEIIDSVQPLVNIKHTGLDPLNQASFKLFIRDVLSLEQFTFEEVDTVGFCLHNHLVTKVEIIGIVVRADIKDIKHSYVVDDGTGVIMCHLWRSFKDTVMPPEVNGLPTSLLEKHCEMKSYYTFRHDGFNLGDSICVQGSVILYNSQKEIDVQDVFKVDDPNCELERVLELPALYSECYSRSFTLPDQMTQIFTCSESDVPMDFERLKFAVLKHIQQNLDSLCDFTLEELLCWPCFYTVKNSKDNNNDNLKTSLIESVLKSISESKGLVCKKYGVTLQYEIIKDGSSFCEEVLQTTRVLCKDKEGTLTGFHVNQIHGMLKCSHVFTDIPLMVVKRSLQCLENTSDIIEVDSHRYLPVL